MNTFSWVLNSAVLVFIPSLLTKEEKMEICSQLQSLLILHIVNSIKLNNEKVFVSSVLPSLIIWITFIIHTEIVGTWTWRCFNFPVRVWSQMKRRDLIYNQAIWRNHIWIIWKLKVPVIYLPCECIIQWLVMMKNLLDFRLKDLLWQFDLL